jgi:hypothetical protein
MPDYFAAGVSVAPHNAYGALHTWVPIACGITQAKKSRSRVTGDAAQVYCHARIWTCAKVRRAAQHRSPEGGNVTAPSTGDHSEFTEYLGDRVRVETDDGRSFVGRVIEVDDDRLLVTTPSGPEWFSQNEIQEFGLA